MQKKKGISLIVLVITIIVMIILAAAIILSLNNAGIIGNANKAVSETDYKTVQTAAQLVYADMMLSETEKPSMMLKQGEYIKEKLISQGTITAEQAAMYRFKNNGEVIKLETEAEYNEKYTTTDPRYYEITADGFKLNEAGLTLEEVVVPYGVTTIADSYTWKGSTGNTTIKRVVMPDTVKRINQFAFYKCINLTEIVIPKNLEFVGYYAFKQTGWLNSLIENTNSLVISEGTLLDGSKIKGNVTIPNTVDVIGVCSFENNTDVSSVTIPSTVQKIEEYAFLQCSNLTNVEFQGLLPELAWGAFGGTNLPDDVREQFNSDVFEEED